MDLMIHTIIQQYLEPTSLQAYIPAEGRMLTLSIGDMTDDERKILVAGSMISYYSR